MSSAGTTEVASAAAACLEYILRLQGSDGSWREWELPPGSSSTWTTAFIGYKLRLLPPWLAGRAAAARRRAAAWLARNEFAGGGWGYNEVVGVDADSTAYSILFLSSLRHAIGEATYNRLCEFRRQDGGFSTYIAQHGRDAWGVSHADVSPVALLAALTKYPRASGLVEQGLRYVLSQLTPSGLWNSFWWESPLYATEVSLSFLNSVGASFDTSQTLRSVTSTVPVNAFEAALAISSAIHICPDRLPDESRFLIGWLVERQQADGSWESAPILRVTRRDCFEPWRCRDAGASFSDPARLFTSSAVLAALSKVVSRGLL